MSCGGRVNITISLISVASASHVTSLVHPPTRWTLKHIRSQVLVPRSCAFIIHISQGRPPVRTATRHCLVSLPSRSRPRSDFGAHLINHARETEPEAFVLQVFFNAHLIGGDPKQKPKATNVLVPTSVAYAGGYVDFPVDMGSEVCLRPPSHFLLLRHNI